MKRQKSESDNDGIEVNFVELKSMDTNHEPQQPLTRNASSVLNDEDLWHVSSSSSSKSEDEDVVENVDDEAVQEEQIASYLVG